MLTNFYKNNFEKPNANLTTVVTTVLLITAFPIILVVVMIVMIMMILTRNSDKLINGYCKISALYVQEVRRYLKKYKQILHNSKM